MSHALDGALASIDRMLDAEAKSKAMILYAENWVYAPAIQKEREIIEKTGAQVLWMHGEEAHSGSHSKAYGFWRLNGGGALIGKGVHPLTAALYLKRVEGRARTGRPIRPAAVSARMHSLTRLPRTMPTAVSCAPTITTSRTSRPPTWCSRTARWPTSSPPRSSWAASTTGSR